jgi:DNA repair exonuclease SbcCD nuclease subunit
VIISINIALGVEALRMSRRFTKLQKMINNNNKNMIGVISDLHLKPNLSYSDYIEGGRKGEEKEILDFIVYSFKDVDKIVFIGDLLHSRTNSPEVIRKLVEFIERFEGKEIYIINGNHEVLSGGSTTLDFLKEIKNPKWHIITKIEVFDDLVFCPYLSNPELKAKNNEAGKKKIMGMLPDGKILFHHYAMSKSKTSTGASTEMFDEIILNRDILRKKYNLVIGGHIHRPQEDGNVIVTGSVFTNEVGETDKYIWKVNEEDGTFDGIKLPGRSIVKVENPDNVILEELKKDSIVKVILTDPKLKNKIEELKEKLKKFDAYILLEQFPSERKKVHFEEGMLEFDIKKLLEVYAKQKKVNIKKLKVAFELIK